MKAKLTLEFDMDERCDREAHLRVLKSLDMALCLGDIQDVLSSLYAEIPEEGGTDLEQKMRSIYQSIIDAFDKYDISPSELTS